MRRMGDENRTPNDVDIVVLTDDLPEYIKELLTDTSDRFILKDPADPRNTYKVLWYVLCWRLIVECKVDIPVPGGDLRIPNIPIRHISFPNSFDIPVMPFFLLLILKLQGWRDHCYATKRHLREKVPQDEEDIEELLETLDPHDHLRCFGWLPTSFLQRARRLVNEYVEDLPETAQSWRYIGFDV
ncbi:hypothetical protein AX17_005152 [Amanita inopinata Kibby_2008]|nr:hypothetical protein AX17_005152 [Amanita inopinata Kibby_2008]